LQLLRDAMAGDGALFIGEDAVEAAWAMVNFVAQMIRLPRCFLAKLGGQIEN